MMMEGAWPKNKCLELKYKLGGWDNAQSKTVILHPRALLLFYLLATPDKVES